MEEATVNMGSDRMEPDPSTDRARQQGGPLPPPNPSAPRVRWFDVPVARQRSRSSLGGVIAGLSAAYGFDRRLARIVVAVLTVLLPSLLLVYVAAWVLLPSGPEHAESLRRLATDKGRLPLLVVLGVALVLSGAVHLGDIGGLHGFGWALALIIVGVMLWLAPERFGRVDASGSRHSPGSGPTTAYAAPPWSPPGAEGTAGATGATAGASAGRQPWSGSTAFAGGPVPPLHTTVHPRRVRRPVGSVTLALTTLGVGLVLAGRSLGWWHVSLAGTIVVTALVLAAGVTASAVANGRFGRLVLVPALVAVAAFVATTAPDLSGGVGQRTFTATSVGELAGPQRLGVGQLTVDGRSVGRVDAAGALRIDARVGVGRLHVLVPAGARLEITAHIGAGELRIDGASVADGVRVDHTRIVPGTPSGPTVVLDVRVGVGSIEIDRGAGPS